MKYFLHDTNAFNDDNISKLFLEFGYEGLGLFYTILEKIGQQEKPIDTKVLKAQLKVGKRLEKCWVFMEKIGIISSSNGDTFNERILSYSETYKIKKEKNREKLLEWRKNQEVAKNVTSSEPVRNSSKVKKSKVNTYVEEIPGHTFEDFWNAYPKKAGMKARIKKLWDKLPGDTKRKAMNHVTLYVSQKEYQYVKNPQGYIEEQRWTETRSIAALQVVKEDKEPVLAHCWNEQEYQEKLAAWQERQKNKIA